jgi:biotin transporter BioY
MDIVSALEVQLTVCLEGVLGSASNGGASVGVYLMLGDVDLIMIVLEE